MITYNPVVQGMGTGQSETPEKIEQSLPIDISGVRNIAQEYASGIVTAADAEARLAAIANAKARQTKEDKYKDEKMQMAREKHAMAIESHQWAAEKMDFARNAEARSQYNFDLSNQQLEDGKKLALAYNRLDAARAETGMSMQMYNTLSRQIADQALANTTLTADQVHSVEKNYSGNVQEKLISAEFEKMKREAEYDEGKEREYLEEARQKFPVLENKPLSVVRDYVATNDAWAQSLASGINIVKLFEQQGRPIPAELKSNLNSTATNIGLQAAINSSLAVLKRQEGLTPEVRMQMQSQIANYLESAGMNKADAMYIAEKSLYLSGADLDEKFVKNYLTAVADAQLTEKALAGGGRNMVNIMANSDPKYQWLMKALIEEGYGSEEFNALGTALENGASPSTSGETGKFAIDDSPAPVKRYLAITAPAVIDSAAAKPEEKATTILGVTGMIIDNIAARSSTGVKAVANVVKNALGEAAVAVVTGGESLITPSPDESQKKIQNSKAAGDDIETLLPLMQRADPGVMTPALRQSITERGLNLYDKAVGEVVEELGKDRVTDLRYDRDTGRIVFVKTDRTQSVLEKGKNYLTEFYDLNLLKDVNDLLFQCERYAGDNRKGFKSAIEDTLNMYGIKYKEVDEDTISPNILTSAIQTFETAVNASSNVVDTGKKMIEGNASLADVVETAADVFEVGSNITQTAEKVNDAWSNAAAAYEEAINRGAEQVTKAVEKLADNLQKRSEENYYKLHPKARGAMKISNIEDEELFQ